MAQTQMTATQAWAAAAADCGTAVHDGQPLVGISGELHDTGYIVPLAAPDWFVHVPADARASVFKALKEAATRVGQAAVKKEETKEKPATRDHAQKGANSAFNGYKPSRERNTDIVESETAKAFEAEIRRRVTANPKMAGATQAAIDDTVAVQVGKLAETDAGKAMLAKFRSEIIARGTYVIARKGKAKASAVTDLDLDLSAE